MRSVRQVSGCHGCPLFGLGNQGFVPDELREGAKVLIVGQNPGEFEEQEGRPFVGKTGNIMDRVYLPRAGLTRGSVSIANALRCRWQDSNELPPLVGLEAWKQGKVGIAEQAVKHCHKAHFKMPGETKLIVAQGEYALYELTGQRGVSNWRGWLLPFQPKSSTWLSEVWAPGLADVPVLSTMHLAALFHTPTMTYPTLNDWQKVRRILAGEWPSPWPGFVSDPPSVWPKASAFDTEFDPTTGVLERYSLYGGGPKPFVVEAGDVGSVKVTETATVVMHNIEADLRYLTGILGRREIRAEDTMLMHAVLWSDLPHDLEFLGSLYARTNRWKHLWQRNPKVYSGGDALGTWDAYLGLVKEMVADPQSAWVYRNAVFPLTPIIMEAETRGLSLDQSKVSEALAYFSARQSEVTRQAQAYTGFPVNLGSPEQVSRWLYQIERVGQKRPRKRGNARD